MEFPSLMIIATAFCLIGTFLPILDSKIWWVRGQAYLRQWYFYLNLFLLILWTFVTPFTALILLPIIGLFMASMFCLRDIIPFTRFYPLEIKYSKDTHKETFSILIFNVKEENERYQDLLNLQKEINPTFLLLLETNSKWEQAVKPLEKKYGHLLKEIREDTYGLMLFSKIEFQTRNINYLSDDEVPSADVTFKFEGQTIQILALHPKPPIPGEAMTTKQKDREFKAAAKKLIQEKDNHLQLVIGDLNDVVWSRTSKKFKKRTGLRDPRVGRGTFSTFPTYAPIRFPLDQILCSPSFELIEIKRLPHIGSDHYPIFVKFAIPKS